MNFTSRTRLNTKIAAPMSPAITTCAGFSRARSCSCPARLLMPRNDQNTAFATCSGEAVFSPSAFIASPPRHPRSVFLEKGVGQRDRVCFGGQARIRYEDDGAPLDFAPAQ